MPTFHSRNQMATTCPPPRHSFRICSEAFMASDTDSKERPEKPWFQSFQTS